MICKNCGYGGEFVDEPATQKPRARDLLYCPCCFWHIRRDGKPHANIDHTSIFNSKTEPLCNADSFEKMIKDHYMDHPSNPNFNRPVW